MRCDTSQQLTCLLELSRAGCLEAMDSVSKVVCRVREAMRTVGDTGGEPGLDGAEPAVGGAATGGITTAGGCGVTGTTGEGAAGAATEEVGGLDETTMEGLETVKGGAFEARLRNVCIWPSFGINVVSCMGTGYDMSDK